MPEMTSLVCIQKTKMASCFREAMYSVSPSSDRSIVGTDGWMLGAERGQKVKVKGQVAPPGDRWWTKKTCSALGGKAINKLSP